MIYVFMIFGAIMIFVVFILPLVQKGTDYSKNIIEKNRANSEQIRQTQKIIKDADFHQKQYAEKKKTFKYLSNEHLLEMYDKDKSTLHPMVQLALEEILVERKLLDYSPTHEKMQRIEKHFTNKKEKQYQMTSENEIKDYASSLSFIIKNPNSSQVEKISNMVKELSENIFYSSFRDIGKVPVDLEVISNPLNFKKEPNQAKYFAIWKSIKDTISELPNHPEIENEIYDVNECKKLVKSLIGNSSTQISKIDNN